MTINKHSHGHEAGRLTGSKEEEEWIFFLLLWLFSFLFFSFFFSLRTYKYILGNLQDTVLTESSEAQEQVTHTNTALMFFACWSICEICIHLNNKSQSVSQVHWLRLNTTVFFLHSEFTVPFTWLALLRSQGQKFNLSASKETVHLCLYASTMKWHTVFKRKWWREELPSKRRPSSWII